jgi:hypothetical protein
MDAIYQSLPLKARCKIDRRARDVLEVGGRKRSWSARAKCGGRSVAVKADCAHPDFVHDRTQKEIGASEGI